MKPILFNTEMVRTEGGVSNGNQKLHLALEEGIKK